MLCYEKNRGTLTVRLSGELDQRCAGQLRKELDELTIDPHIKHLVFDLNDLSFMDSSGIGLMIGRYKQMRRRGGERLLEPRLVAGSDFHGEQFDADLLRHRADGVCLTLPLVEDDVLAHARDCGKLRAVITCLLEVFSDVCNIAGILFRGGVAVP